MKKIIANSTELKALVGKILGTSDYIKIDQQRINNFAVATGDHQWIHTDPEKAKNESPFKATIAHGYLTVSLMPMLLDEIYHYDTDMIINYAIDNLKFRQAVIVDSEVCLEVGIKDVKDLRGTLKTTLSVTLKIKDEKKPAFTGEVVFLYN